MTEEEALDRVDEIGTAFDNDLNDGEGPDWESVSVSNGFLIYSGTWADGGHVEYRWRLSLSSRGVGFSNAEHG